MMVNQQEEITMAKKRSDKPPTAVNDAEEKATRTRRPGVRGASIALETVHLSEEEVTAIIFDGSGSTDVGDWRDAVAAARTAVQDVAGKAVSEYVAPLVTKLREHRHQAEIEAAEREAEAAAAKLAELKAKRLEDGAGVKPLEPPAE